MAGRIQKEDVKTVSDLQAAGRGKDGLINDTQIYASVVGSYTLAEAIQAGLIQDFPPLRLYASATPDSKLNISASQIQLANGSTRTQPPFASSLPSFPTSTVDFQSGAVTGGTFSPVSGSNLVLPSTTVGQYRRAVFTLLRSGTMQVNFSSAAVTIGALPDPGLLVVPGNIPVGFIDLQATAASSYRTVGSVTNIIENATSGISRVFNFILSVDNWVGDAVLVRGGNWSWNSTTGILSWDSAAAIQVPGLSESANALPSGNIALSSDGQVAYANINRFGTGGNLTLNSGAISSLSPSPTLVIIARRIGNDVLVGTTQTIKLSNSESQTLDSGLSNQTLSYIGVADETISSPSYSTATGSPVTNNYATDGDSLTKTIKKLDIQAGTEALYRNQDRNMNLINGGTWSWNASTGLLTWSSIANIAVSGLADSANSIPIGNVTLTDGQCAYVSVNRSGSGGNLSVSAAAQASVPNTDNVLVIARRSGSNCYIGTNGEVLLASGQSQGIDAGTSNQVLSYLGSPDAATSSPAYTTANGGATSNYAVADGDNLTKAVKKLDSQASVLDGFINQDRNLQVINGGTWSWNSTTGVLSWSSTANVMIPGLADSANSIAAGSATLTDGQVAYVAINRSGPGGALTVNIAGVSSLSLTDNLVVFARRSGATVYVGANGEMLLQSGETQTFGAALSDQERTFIGIANDATSSPAWNTSQSAPLRTIPSDSSSIVSAVASIDTQIDKFFGQLRITPTSGNSQRVSLSGSDVTMLDNSIRSQIIKNIVMNFSGAQIQFTGANAGTIYASDGTTSIGTFTSVTPTTGQYRWYSVALIPNTVGSDNRISVQLSVNAASADGASLSAAPRASFPNNGTPIGQFCVQNNAGTLQLASGGILQLGFGSGSGTSSSSGATNAPADGYRAMVSDAFDVGPTDSTSKINSTFTTASYNTANSLYAMSCDKSKTITVSGLNFTLSGAPSFTIAPGCIIWINSLSTFRRVATILSQTAGTLDTAFPSNVSAVAGMVSQAVWSNDLVNYGDSTQLTRLRDQFPSTSINAVNLDYADSISANDSTPDFVSTALVVASATNSGLQSDTSTFPTTDQWTNIFTRPTWPNQIVDYGLSVNTNQQRFFLCFFPNPNNGSVVSLANLISFDASLYQKSLANNGGFLYSAFCMSDSSGTASNCSNPSVVSGKTRVALNWIFIPNTNAPYVDGDIEVIVEGQVIPRFYAGIVGAYWKEVTGSNNTVELWTDLSSVSYSIQIRKRQGSIDVSARNSLVINARYTAVVGSAAQVTSGLANYSSLQLAISAVGAVGGGTILLLGNVTENVSFGSNTNIKVIGQGRLSSITGNLTVNSNYNDIDSVRVVGNISVSGNNNFLKCWTTGTFTNTGAANDYRISVE